MYTHRISRHGGGSSSVFLTVNGMKEIMNTLPDANEEIKLKAMEMITNKNILYNNDNYQHQHNYPQAAPINQLHAPPPPPSSSLTIPTTNKGVYVLRVDDSTRARPFFYVGKADNIERRIKQHADGDGAYCIAGEQFTRVEPLTKGSVDDMESWERNEVLTRMHEFGIDNVRGWMYTFKNMPIEQKVSAFDQVCEKFDFCRKCGRNSHFVRDCYRMSTDLWTCGMELRPTYNSSAHQQAAIEEAERRISDARRMVAEAGRVLGAL